MTHIIVIGGGVAGLQAATFTAKAGEKTTVLDTDESLVQNTSNIQNLIGHDSIGGHELLRRGRDKVEEFGGEILNEKVTDVDRTDDGFKVITEDGEHEADYIILATAGTHDYMKNLDLEFEDGVEGPYMMDEHVVTDDRNKAAEEVYAAGLTNTWEYQTSVAIGDGAKAAINLLSDLYGEPYEDHDT
jgi:thioredoxin reductase